MKNLKGGLVCAAIGCKNKSYRCNKSFFSFPIDPIRARKWAIASTREDLLPKIQDLYKGYRLCGDHFESVMFTSKSCNRLKRNAVPTIFPSLKGLLKKCYFTVDHTYSRPAVVHLDTASISPPQESSPRNITLEQSMTPAEIPELQHDMSTNSEPADIPPDLQLADIPLDLQLADIPPDLQPADIPPDLQPADIPPDQLSANRSSQTSNTSSSNTPRKRKYIESPKSLKIGNKRLKTKIKDLEQT